jgi:hypothetical protein
MTPEDFNILLECYGADLSRWPEERQGPAGHYLRSHTDARARLEQMAALDRLIVAAAPEVSDARTEAAIRAVSDRTLALPQTPAWVSWAWAPGGLTYAAMFLLGGAGNLLARLASQESPLEHLFSGTIFSAFGG